LPKKKITVLGAGICGLWQALTLTKAGHAVTLVERSEKPFEGACSFYAGAMLAPYAEEEGAEQLIRDLGLRSIELWRETYPETQTHGSLIVAQARDRKELDRFERMTQGHERVSEYRIAELEPDLADRYSSGLYFAGEAHVHPHQAMDFLLNAAIEAGAVTRFGCEDAPRGADLVIDCRGLAARDDLSDLRGVRGERLVIRTGEVNFTRPVRLLHPRFPLYVVPWGYGFYLVGATQIESDEAGPVTVRSALELLSTAYTLHPAFGEAEIVGFGAGARPSFPDNLPRIIVNGSHIHVNGLYRHGFLLAPALAELTASYIEDGATHPEVFS
jgi:glycine oxidase